MDIENNTIHSVSSTEADWNREKCRRFWDPSRKLLKSIRDYEYWQKKGFIGKLPSKICVMRHSFWQVICACEIPINCKIGGGLVLPHPNGIVIHPKAIIGVNCLIHQQVTIGVKRGNKSAPTIHGHVDIGAGAKILGGISIGEHALIGANSVVINDVMPSQIVAGVPAKVLQNNTYKISD